MFEHQYALISSIFDLKSSTRVTSVQLMKLTGSLSIEKRAHDRPMNVESRGDIRHRDSHPARITLKQRPGENLDIGGDTSHARGFARK